MRVAVKQSRIITASLLLAAASQLSCTAKIDQFGRDMEKMRANVRRLVTNGIPPAVYYDQNGNPTISWRLSIKHVLNTEPPLTDQPWTSQWNQQFDTQIARSDFSLRAPNNLKGQPEHTSLFALVGQGTAFTEFGGMENIDRSKLPNDAILLLECKRKIHWMQPGDIQLDELVSSESPIGIGDLSPNYPDGYLVAFADGAVWYIKKDVPKEAISKFFTVDGAAKFDREKILGPYVLDRTQPLDWF